MACLRGLAVIRSPQKRVAPFPHTAPGPVTSFVENLQPTTTFSQWILKHNLSSLQRTMAATTSSSPAAAAPIFLCGPKCKQGYKPYMDRKKTEIAIYHVKRFFQKLLFESLNLQRVSAPIVVQAGLGINDDLNGIEAPVSFIVKDMQQEVQVVQSLAKWKRLALAKYHFTEFEGLFTDMNALRPDETLDNLHSIYVDQWDWERVINQECRSLSYLKETVKRIYTVLRATEQFICSLYPELPSWLPENITFVHTEELEQMYPSEWAHTFFSSPPPLSPCVIVCECVRVFVSLC